MLVTRGCFPSDLPTAASCSAGAAGILCLHCSCFYDSDTERKHNIHTCTRALVHKQMGVYELATEYSEVTDW